MATKRPSDTDDSQATFSISAAGTAPPSPFGPLRAAVQNAEAFPEFRREFLVVAQHALDAINLAMLEAEAAAEQAVGRGENNHRAAA